MKKTKVAVVALAIISVLCVSVATQIVARTKDTQIARTIDPPGN